MQKPNIFYSLFKYNATPNREPLEDYFTELIGFLFDFNKEFTSKWIRQISKEDLTPNPETLKVFTQYSLGDFGRADLALIWTEHDIPKSLLMEHKIESAVGIREISEIGDVKTQIHKYLEYQTGRGSCKDHRVAFFKKSPLPSPLISDITQSPYFLGEFNWTRLFKCLDKFMTTESKSVERATTKFLCQQILEFMRRQNMIFENFTVHDLASISPYNEFINKLKKLVERIQAEFSKPMENLIPKSCHLKLLKADSSDLHGGLIIHNLENYNDSSVWIHVGTSMYTEDRYCRPITLRNQRIPDVQVMLGLWFDPKNLAEIKKKCEGIYNKLNDYLAKGHITDTSFEIFLNDKFICFHFRKPLSDFLKCEDQEKEVITFLKGGFEAISNLEEEGILSKLVNDECFQ